MIAQLVLSLSILVVLHEFGHFLPARWFKVRVEKFYLFFDPWFELVKKKIGDTEYGIGWLPLGGYVKLSGMIDESMDTEQMKQPPQPWEFRSKPAWQRLIIMLGGVTVNFILGFLIFGMILFIYGESYLPSKNATYGIAVDSIAYDMGLRDGDHILRVGDRPFDKFEAGVIRTEIAINNATEIEVERDGQNVVVPIDPKFVRILSSSENAKKTLIMERFPFYIKSVDENSPAEVAGLLAEDQVIGLGGEPTPYYHQVNRALRLYKGEQTSIEFIRNRDTLSATVRPTEAATIGVGIQTPLDLFEYEEERYSFAESIPAGVAKGWNFLSVQFSAFGQIAKGKIKASESLGGFGTITNLFPRTWDWRAFWYVTAILSLILGFMNLLPIPALDGGHVMFLIYEVISGRKPSDKFMEYATMVGFALVLLLVLYANGLDVWRWVTGKF